jgi:hypothetical protein
VANHPSSLIPSGRRKSACRTIGSVPERGRARIERRRIDGHVRPLQKVRARQCREALHGLDATAPEGRLERQKEHSEGHVALRDRLRVGGKAVEKERPRDVELHPRAVARGASVVETGGKFEGRLDEATLRDAL